MAISKGMVEQFWCIFDGIPYILLKRLRIFSVYCIDVQDIEFIGNYELYFL